MDKIIQEFIDLLQSGVEINGSLMSKVIYKHNKPFHSSSLVYTKSMLMPYLLEQYRTKSEIYKKWNMDENVFSKLQKILQIKPRRTTSGVATITVMTKPMTCSSNCIYCPNDMRMPKSYLSDEPVCQRAERTYFDPFLQVTARLKALDQMGHNTSKIEMIILGGTWSDYPIEYQIWYISQCFRAVNDYISSSNDEDFPIEYNQRLLFYKENGLENDPIILKENILESQTRLENFETTYNQEYKNLYTNNISWNNVSKIQTQTFENLFDLHKKNAIGQRKIVGLVIETRPDLITYDNLKIIRSLGCTKIQIGVQSLDPCILKANNRNITIEKIQEAFELLRDFGFKIHAHFMVNLYLSTPSKDIEDYKMFVTDPRFMPDELKLYPLILVDGTKLVEKYNDKSWIPYSEEDLIKVLVADTLITPPFCRISRMIRDISAHDIMAGNKKGNLRQLVENEISSHGSLVQEIRLREIAGQDFEFKDLSLDIIHYETSNSTEYFLQYITPENKIAGFMRLSFTKPSSNSLFEFGRAMIREIHIYGKVAGVGLGGTNSQHLGLGTKLIEKASEISLEKSYNELFVISSIGTREYYSKRGFTLTKDNLYQVKNLG